MLQQNGLKNFFSGNHEVDSSLRSKLFRLQDVNVSFGKIKALRNVQFTVEAGEILFITGASGAGKTTLLNLLSGDILPTSGLVQRPESTIFISNVFQDLRLIGRLSCFENLKLSYDPSIYKNRAEFMQDLGELSRILGIKDRLELTVSKANGGLKQKVAIIRALLSKPDIFIADEPTSSLDADNAKKLFDVLNLYNAKKGMTVIWASHNKDLVKKFTGRIVHLDSGKLIYSGHACFI